MTIKAGETNPKYGAVVEFSDSDAVAVEKKLYALLDADGGIRKTKDASKGYLKLLLLTSASGDSGNGDAIQSNRILSMILDAMLKTKSHGVLRDIINKKGLQMLHNMMKLHRRDFKKIPILRKLLKVLEFLAEKKLLTVQHINVDSHHPGVESFRESILSFTEHDDFQVHNIARSFRDRWIPDARKFHRLQKTGVREFGRVSNSSRHLGSCHDRREQGVEPLSCSRQSRSMSNVADARSEEASPTKLVVVNRPRKRKSRWDQPSSPEKKRKRSKVNNSEGGESGATNEGKKEDGDENVWRHRGEDDEALSWTSVGVPGTRFNQHLPVAYGIPLSIVEKLGYSQCGSGSGSGSGSVDSWGIAPAMHFQPFPPLPPHNNYRKRSLEP